MASPQASTSALPAQSEEPAQAGVAKNGDWTAVFSPEANAYYFWNSKTNETTWTNPLESAEAGTSTSGGDKDGEGSGEGDKATEGEQKSEEDKQRELYGGIDPDLAYLDPSLAARAGGKPGAPAGGAGIPAFTAKFNARTGRFQGSDAAHLTPDRISDFQRSERQQSAFYDVDGWRESLAGRARKEMDAKNANRKPTKADVERFKANKEAKKKKKLASWLAD